VNRKVEKYKEMMTQALDNLKRTCLVDPEELLKDGLSESLDSLGRPLLRYSFDNGWGASVLARGEVWEVIAVKEGMLDYDCPVIPDREFRGNADQINDVLRRISEL